MRKKMSDEMLRERERASVQYEEQEYDIVLKNDKNLEELTKLTMDIVKF